MTEHCPSPSLHGDHATLMVTDAPLNLFVNVSLRGKRRSVVSIVSQTRSLYRHSSTLMMQFFVLFQTNDGATKRTQETVAYDGSRL